MRRRLHRTIAVLLVVCFVVYVGVLLYSFHGLQLQKKRLQWQQMQAQVWDEKYKEAVIAQRKQTPFYLPILMYHYVEEVTDLNDTIRMGLNIHPDIFKAQIETLLAHGYKPIRFEDVEKYFNGEAPLPEKPVIFTFDDGYQDFYTDVWPILEEYQVPGTAFVVSGFADYTKNYMTTEQLLEINKSSLVEIGPHSVNHPALNLISLVVAQQEIVKSKADLEVLLGRPMRYFAYPYGHYNAQIVELTRQAGFEIAVGVEEGVWQSFERRFQMRRIRPGRKIGEALIFHLEHQPR